MATLDQMNAYMVLLAPILPEPHRQEWLDDLTRLSIVLIDHYYNWDENLFYLASDKPADRDPKVSGTDFGHTIKSFWMIRWTGVLTGNPRLVESGGRRVLERAYRNGSWVSGVKADGALDLDKSWWIYAELDQFAATLSIQDPTLAAQYLDRTYDYWQRYFVDPLHGEVWTTVSGATNLPIGDLPKQWPWKNGYHSLEHALVAYITAAARAGEAVTLYFAATEPGVDFRPYFFQASGASGEGSRRLCDCGALRWCALTLPNSIDGSVRLSSASQPRTLNLSPIRSWCIKRVCPSGYKLSSS